MIWSSATHLCRLPSSCLTSLLFPADWGCIGQDHVIGFHVVIPVRDQLIADGRMFGCKVLRLARIGLKIIELPLASPKGLAEPEQLPIALPNGPVAEELPSQPV